MTTKFIFFCIFYIFLLLTINNLLIVFSHVRNLKKDAVKVASILRFIPN